MTNDKTREDFEAWASDDWQWPQCVERTGDAYKLMQTKLKWEAWKEATQQSAARIAALEAERADFRDASKVNFENYEFQRRKADAATASVYQFHYAMKDAGWHPGRTDDNLCDIIRAKGAELAKLEAEVLALRKDAERLDWSINNACISSEHWGGRWSIVFEGKAPDTLTVFATNPQAAVRSAIDAAIQAERGEG